MLLVTRVPDFDVILLMLCSGREADDESDRQGVVVPGGSIHPVELQSKTPSYKQDPENKQKQKSSTCCYIRRLYSWGRGTLIVSIPKTFPRMKLSFPIDETVTFYEPTSYLYIRPTTQYVRVCACIHIIRTYICVRLLLLLL